MGHVGRLVQHEYGNGFNVGEGLFDILIFAALAAFVLFRLFRVLGRRTGNERPPPSQVPGNAANEQDNVVPLPGVDQQPEDSLAGIDGPLRAGMTQIRLADGSFDPEQFLAGARSAFEMILDSFHKGELEKVRPFLDNDVYRSFATAVTERESAENRRIIELIAINRCEAIEAEMQGRQARITIRFESDQTDILKDSEDRIVAGDPSTPIEVTDIWIFGRDTKSRDPNWQLVATRNPN
jgi:predicted lipid-binding transport protein (Tim44 family)